MDPAGNTLYAAGYFNTIPVEPFVVDRFRLSDFTLVAPAFKAGLDEYAPGPITVDPNGGFLLVASHSLPAKIIKIDTQNFTRVGTGALRPNTEQGMSSILFDANRQYAFVGMGTSPGRILTFEPSPKPLRLGLYGMTSSDATLLWQSPPRALTEAGQWLTVGVSEGTPSSLNLLPGDYALAWQADADESVPSFAPGSPGEGIRLPIANGAFPARLSAHDAATSWTSTSSRWSTYIDYDAVSGARDWKVWK